MADEPKPAKRARDGWKQQSKQTTARATPADRQAQIYRLLLTMGIILAVIIGMIFMLRWPARGQILPICISEYTDPRLPPHAFAAQDARLWSSSQLDYRQPGELQQRDGILRALDGLRQTKRHQTVIVHITGHALPDREGRLCLIPGNADADSPEKWIPFADILQSVADSPADNKLLIVDVMRPVADPRLGVLANDAAERLDRLITNLQKERPDDAPVVLTACSPGENSLVSEELGHSVFGWYLHKGRFDGANSNQDNSLVVQELADWVSAGVKNWALINRAESQTPKLYNVRGRNFEVEPISKRPGSAGLGEVSAKVATLPAWLVQEWQQRDDLAKPIWWGRGVDRLASREPGQLDRLLLRVEEQWRGDPEVVTESERNSADASARNAGKENDQAKEKDKDKDKGAGKAEEKPPAAAKDKDAAPAKAAEKPPGEKRVTETPSQALRGGLVLLKERIGTIEKEGLARMPAAVPYSLAMARALGTRPNDQVLDAIRAQVKAFSRLTATTKPEQVQAAIPELIDKLKPGAVAWKDAEVGHAILALAIDAGSELDQVQFLDRLLRELKPEARYVETLQLRDLVALLGTYRDFCRKAEVEIPTGMFADALRTVRDAEQARACLSDAGRVDPRVFAVMAEPIRKALQDHHVALVLFRSPGYVSFEEISRRLKESANELQTLSGMLQGQIEAYARLDEALRDLPAYADYLVRWSRLETADMSRWNTAVQAVTNLIRALRAGRSPGAPINPGVATARVAEALVRIREDLGLTTIRETVEEAERRLKEGTSAEARRQSLKQLGRLLQTSWLKAEERAQVYTTARKLARLLADMTGENAKPGNVRESSIREERDRGFNRARIALGLLTLADYAATADLETALREAVAAAPDKEDEALTRLGEVLRKALDQGLSAQLDKPAVDLFDRDIAQRSRVALADLLQGNPLDARSNPTLALLRERASALLQFQGDQLSYEASDFEGVEPGQRRELSAFLTKSARDLRTSWDPPISFGRMSEVNLKQGNRSASTELTLFGSGAATVQTFTPGASLIEVQTTPDTLKLDKTAKVKLDLRLGGGFEEAGSTPKGILVQVQANGVALHQRLPVLFPEATNRLPRLLVGLRDGTPTEAATVPVRAGVNQTLFVSVQNPSKEPRLLQVDVYDPDEPGVIWLQSDATKVEGQAQARLLLRKAALPVPMKPGEGPGVLLRKGLGVRLVDISDKAKPQVIQSRSLQFPLIDPSTLIRAEVRWFPPADGAGNRIRVVANGKVTGEPCNVRLVLDRDGIPDLVDARPTRLTGTIGGEIVQTELLAEDLRFERDRAREAEVSLSVDGVDRALVFTGSLDMRGADATLEQFRQRRVGLTGFQDRKKFVDPRSDAIPMQIVVVNPPELARVRVTRKSTRGGRILEEPRILPARTVNHYLKGVDDGGIQLQTLVSNTPLDLRIQGNVEPQIIELAMIDPRGQVLTTDEYRLIPDGTQPEEVKFDSVAGKKVQGESIELTTFGFLPVVARGTDPESGIKKVTFYLGRPDENGNPPKEGSPIPGKAVEENTYGAEVELRAGQGTWVSAEFINGVGRRAWATVLVKPPLVTATTGGGNAAKALNITGIVYIGVKEQVGLTVVLQQQNGVVVGQTKTDAQGRFAFNNQKPGQYTVFSTDGASVPKKALSTVNLTTSSVDDVTLSLR